MNPPRWLGVGVGGVGLIAAAARLWSQLHLGFPDGHLTALERTLRAPHLALAALLFAAGLALLRWRRWRWRTVAAGTLRQIAGRAKDPPPARH